MDIAKIVSLATISLLAAMSPGPDFAVLTRNCIRGTFRTGLLTTLGITTALFIHISYCLFGIAFIIQESPTLFHLLKYLGAGYLFYLGILMLKEKTSPEGAPEVAQAAKKKHHPFLSGFFCNLLNPKATLFVLSIFTQFIDTGMSLPTKVLLGSVFAAMTFFWFLFLSYLITHRMLQKHFSKFQFVITKAMGGILCALGVYVAFFS
jgi:RhtB (resistance to homoserine/threonine) family protein